MIQPYSVLSSTLRGNVRIPGIPVLPPDTERHIVAAGGSTAIAMDAGDRITLVDPEGLQPAELVMFDSRGRGDAGLLGTTAHDGTPGYAAYRASPDAGSSRDRLRKRGIDLDSGVAVPVFQDGSRPGDSAEFTISADGVLLVLAPGAPMHAWEQNPPTDIVVFIRRSRPRTGRRLAPPDPFADPLLDLNIQPGNATGFEVRAGDYIQVVDVQGRECSDFQGLRCARA